MACGPSLVAITSRMNPPGSVVRISADRRRSSQLDTKTDSSNYRMVRKNKKQQSVLSSQFSVGSFGRLDLLQSLHVVNAGDLTHAIDDVFQVFQVGNVEHDVDIRLAVVGTGLDVADVGLGIADHGGYLLQHPKTIVAEDRKLHRIGAGRSVVLGPLHIDLAFRFI